ncbi:hypothetical protein D5S17_32465 [Pseudonocardiaceae bacterium YIM PH 21723]|nr:hypothetical protein D5S17_32465 [Pseudonocardiaceae bacterium YIM PH 21723]
MALNPYLEVFEGNKAVLAGAISEKDLRTKYRPLFTGVHTWAGAELTHELRCQAAALIAPPGSVITGRSAATIRGVDLAKPMDPVEMIVPADRRPPRRPGFRTWSGTVPVEDSEPWHEVRLATPKRIGLDLLTKQSVSRAVADVDAATRAGLIDLDELRAHVDVLHCRGVTRARTALDLVNPLAESLPESELRVLLHRDGLAAIPQVEVRCNGVFIGRVDLGFPEYRVAVEYEGRWHADPQQFAADQRRREQLYAAGWLVVLVTAEQLYGDPQGVVARVREALDGQRSSRS